MSDGRQPTEEEFLKDVQHHQMTIPLNEGVYRHVRFRSTKHGWNQWFDLTTWPGMLTISGDMGTWSFSRLPDMFDFFRGSKINPSYWAEKLQHGNFSGRQGGKVWDEDVFKERLLDMLKNCYEFKGKKLKEITKAVTEEVFRQEYQHAMVMAAYEFTYEFEADRKAREKREETMLTLDRWGSQRQAKKFQFDGVDLPDGMVYSFHLIWCMYAIVWGIQQYDNGMRRPAEIPIAS